MPVKWSDGRQPQVLWRRGRIWSNCGYDTELHELAGRGGVGNREILTGYATPKWFIGSDIAENVIANRHVGKVDDHIGAFGQPHQESVAMVRREVDRRRQKPAFVTNHPDFHAGYLVEVQDQEP